MPKIESGSFEVSREEERYLRRAFRRFARPYLIGLLALAGVWAAVAGFRVGPAHDPAEAPEIQGLISESASLRQAIVSLREEVAQVAARAEEGVNRISSLEKRVAKISDATEAVGAARLRKRLEEAHQRINALDARLAAVTAAARENTRERERAATLPAPASSGTAGGAWPADRLPR
jgi:TolA-binding protein